MTDLFPSVSYASVLVSFPCSIGRLGYFFVFLKFNRSVPGRRYYHFDNYHAGSRSERLQDNNRAA